MSPKCKLSGEFDFSTTYLTRHCPATLVSGLDFLESLAKDACFEVRAGAATMDACCTESRLLSLQSPWESLVKRPTFARKLASSNLQKRPASVALDPIQEKESIRWLEGLEMANQAALACPETTCVCVGGSESDIYELFGADPDKTRTRSSAGRAGIFQCSPRRRRSRVSRLNCSTSLGLPIVGSRAGRR